MQTEGAEPLGYRNTWPRQEACPDPVGFGAKTQVETGWLQLTLDQGLGGTHRTSVVERLDLLDRQHSGRERPATRWLSRHAGLIAVAALYEPSCCNAQTTFGG
jgi:hypothetical protein